MADLFRSVENENHEILRAIEDRPVLEDDRGAIEREARYLKSSTICAVPLRIALDLDGVLADMEGRVARETERLLAQQAARSHRHRLAAGTPRSQVHSGRPNRLWRHLRKVEDFWEQLEEVEPGALARLAEVATKQRWETIFLTSRPDSAGATVQTQTQRWLQSRGFPLPSVYVVQGSRGRIAAALDLDVVVDDNPANCLEVVVDSRASAVLVWRHQTRPPAATERYRIDVVGSVAECLDRLAKFNGRAPKAGMIDRVRRFLTPKTGARNPSSQ